MRAMAATLLVTAWLAGACDPEPPPSAPDVTTSSGAPTTGSAVGGPTSPPPATPAGEGDWDGVRYDLGVLDRIDRTEDGRILVVFDRVQLSEGLEAKEAKDFTEEPIVYGNTDAPFLNDNPRLRTYVADPAVEVLRIANLRDTCSDRDDAAEAVWQEVTVDDVVRDALWDEYQQVSLTFDPRGRVIRIRLSSSC